MKSRETRTRRVYTESHHLGSNNFFDVGYVDTEPLTWTGSSGSTMSSKFSETLFFGSRCRRGSLTLDQGLRRRQRTRTTVWTVVFSEEVDLEGDSLSLLFFLRISETGLLDVSVVVPV